MPERLRKVDPALFHYQKGLAALALLDGDERTGAAAESFTEFRRKLNRLAEAKREARKTAENAASESRFYQWVKEHVNRQVFAGIPEEKELNRADITVLDKHWQEHRSAMEEIEDVFTSHLTVGNISAEIVSS